MLHGWDLGQVPEASPPPAAHAHSQASCHLGPKAGVAGHGLRERSGKCGCGEGAPQRVLLSSGEESC